MSAIVRHVKKRQTTWIVTLSMSLGLTLAPVLALALDPAPKCESGKLKEVGKYANCRLKAESVAVKKGIEPDYTKCVEKFSGKWTNLETKGAGQCPTEGDYGAMEAGVTRETTNVAACLAGACPARLCQGSDPTVCALLYVYYEKYLPGLYQPSPCMWCAQELGDCGPSVFLGCTDDTGNMACNLAALGHCAAECCDAY